MTESALFFLIVFGRASVVIPEPYTWAECRHAGEIATSREHNPETAAWGFACVPAGLSALKEQGETP